MLICAHSYHMSAASSRLVLDEGSSAYHVELRAHGRTCRVQSNELTAEQILAWCNAFGDSDGLNALVGDKAVDAPFAAIEGILSDLEGMELVFDIRLREDDSVSKI
jgi:hypothetical protein